MDWTAPRVTRPLGEGVGSGEAQRLLVELDGAREQRVVVAADAADAVEEMVHLVDEGLDQRAGVGLDERQQRAEGRGAGPGVPEGEPGNGSLALAAAVLEVAGLLLDGDGEAHHLVGVALEKKFLLVFEQREQAAVFGEFGAQAPGDVLPGGGSGIGRGHGALVSVGAATGVPRGVSCLAIMGANPMPLPSESFSASESVSM